MSGVAAIVQTPTFAPDQSRYLDRMLAASAHRGPDGTSVWRDGCAALGYLAFETIDDAPESQPLVDTARGLALVFDGRLDDRDALATALDAAQQRWTDARLALEAFARWDAGAPARMLGDFAWIGWDARRRRLVAARDHLGVRPLHFHTATGLVLAASDVAQILAHPSVPREPDLGSVADLLSLDVPNGAATLLRGVGRVPPGHVLVFEDGRLALREYWRAAPGAPLRLARDEDYADRCRELLDASVSRRVRSRRPVAALLSGGLDSSSVVACAARALDGAPALTPFSLVFPQRPDADERPFIADVAAHCGLAPVLVEPAAVTAGAMRTHAAGTLDCPGFASDFGASSVYRAIRERGHDIVLTGAGGDYLFAGSIFRYADLLREWRVAAAVRQFLHDRGTDSSGSSRLALLQAGVWPLLPARIKRGLRPLARRVAGIPAAPAWLRLQRTTPLPPIEPPRGGSFATEEVTRELTGGLHSLFLEAGERVLARVPLEARHPFLDVRLVEFALSLPEEQRRRGPMLKFVLRNALRGRLPPSVEERRSKASFGYVIVEALDAFGGERFFNTLQIAAAGWVDGRDLARRYVQTRRQYDARDATYEKQVPWLWIAAATELWFVAAFGERTYNVSDPARGWGLRGPHG